MYVLICPDKFAGTLSAIEAADAIASGWAGVASGDRLDRRPLADGGPGFLDVIEASLGDTGTRTGVPAVDPLGRPVTADILLAGSVESGRVGQEPAADGSVGYLESAQTCGLHLLSAAERNPKIASSYGLGAPILAAQAGGAREIIIGLGGSSTNDGGAGLIEALGVTPLGPDGTRLARGGAALSGCVDLRGTPATKGVLLVGASDVDNPLTGIMGASAVYGPQKGASHQDVLVLDAALEQFARVLQDRLPGCPPDLAARPGAGAAGGLGAAILALGGELRSGIGLVRDLTGLDAALDAADLVITGEGSVDAQSLRGKVVAGIANAARDRGLPCVVLAGRASAGRRESAAAGITDTYTLVEHFGGSVDQAMTDAAGGLRALGARLARQWSVNR